MSLMRLFKIPKEDGKIGLERGDALEVEKKVKR